MAYCPARDGYPSMFELEDVPGAAASVDRHSSISRKNVSRPPPIAPPARDAQVSERDVGARSSDERRNKRRHTGPSADLPFLQAEAPR
jgi:hypothetical protein